jgi:hypothetical protein
MAQKPRTIHPDDAQDDRLARLPLPAAYTYAYLPTVLDDEGRARFQPAVLNGYLWPLRAEEHPIPAMTADLDALTEAGLVCRYSVEGQDYLHDRRWRQRQRIARPIPSTLPGCPTHNKTFDDVIAETVTKVSEQVTSVVGSAASNIDTAKIRDSVVRIVEDVTFLVDPDKAVSYGQKVRGFFTKTGSDITGERPTTGTSANGKSTPPDPPIQLPPGAPPTT